ncbi:hypothetical protein Iz_06 [Brucella phage Iz]|nr:hypothetical protein Iz_06 [Brucella phage Iz]
MRATRRDIHQMVTRVQIPLGHVNCPMAERFKAYPAKSERRR